MCVRRFRRTTVWKDMVERERKSNAATVDTSRAGSIAWFRRYHQFFVLPLSVAVFAALLSARLPKPPPCLKCHWQQCHVQGCKCLC